MYYVVQQGDHLAGIAKKSGFTNYRSVWDHPNNSGLQAKRKNPNVLLPGDRVFVPVLERGAASRGTDRVHRFKLKGPPLTLRLILEDLYEKPIANATCVLVVDGIMTRTKTDGSGKVARFLSPDDQHGVLVIQDPQTPFNGARIGIRIGCLDPVEEVSGQAARLKNLGYLLGELDSLDSAAFRSAVEEFQCDFGLTVDAVCGPATQAKLKEEHGC